MAISIKTQPGDYYSVHGDLLYVVEEATKAADPVTYPDYRYIADVYVGADVHRLKAYPQPDTLMGIFNTGSIIRSYITPVFNPINPTSTFDSQTLDAGDFNVSGVVVFGEEYGFTLFPATIAGVGKKFFGHYNGRMLGTLTNLAAYYGKIATVRPDRTSVYRNSLYNFLPYFVNTSGITVNIESYTEAGVLQGVVNDTIAKPDGSMQIFNISPDGINASYPPIIDANTAYYTVDLGTSRRLTIDLVCESKYTVHTLHFLNRFGGFESKDFTKVSRKTIDIEKKDFGKLPYTVDGAGLVSYYNDNNVYNETRSVYSSQYKEKMVLNTDALTDEEYIWLADLVLSPMVYLEMDGYFIPVIITGTNYEFKKSINDKITNLTINIEFGDQFNAQYR